MQYCVDMHWWKAAPAKRLRCVWKSFYVQFDISFRKVCFTKRALRVLFLWEFRARDLWNCNEITTKLAPYLVLLITCNNPQKYQLCLCWLKRQFNRQQATQEPLDTNLESITGGTLTTLTRDSGKDGVARDEAANRIGMVTQHPILQCVFAGFKEHEWELSLTLYLHSKTLLISESTRLPKAKAVLMLDKAL